MLEYREIYGNYYGTSKLEMDIITKEEKVLIDRYIYTYIHIYIYIYICIYIYIYIDLSARDRYRRSIKDEEM